MAIYLSMQRARFSSAAGYEKFKNIFADVRHHLKTLPGFLHFELASTRLLRICPVCSKFQDKPYDLAKEQQVLAQPCPQCGYHFPVMPETPSSFAVFKDAE